MTLHRILIPGVALLSAMAFNALADEPKPCATADRACLAAMVQRDAAATTETAWRDQTLRDLAASLTYDKKVDSAIALIPQISNPDTQAMTVRAIGMAAALYGRETPDQLKTVFAKLAKATLLIRQPTAQGIAQTYIAMAQAFGGLDDDAWRTASAMTNLALKHKAFGETAEIQAERGDMGKAMTSVGKIDVVSFRNKAYQNVAEIMTKRQRYDDAVTSAGRINNPAKRAQAILAIMKAQEEKTRGARADTAPEVDSPLPEANGQ